MRFQDLFHSPPGVLFAFPSRYLFTIGRLLVFSLGGWSPHLQTGFLVSRPTFLNFSTFNSVSLTGLSPSTVHLPRWFCCQFKYQLKALPISLATTFGISVDFFSCSYLDVSVHCVRFPVYNTLSKQPHLYTYVCLLDYFCCSLRSQRKHIIDGDNPCGLGCPIRTSTDQCSFVSSPWLFADYYVLHRL